MARFTKPLKTLLGACQTAHPHCQKALSNAPLPTRLLHLREKVSTFPEVRLRQTSPRGSNGQYVALSYCWGGPQSFRLTDDNLESLQQVPIDNNLLPKLINNAVLVTLTLGFEYL